MSRFVNFVNDCQVVLGMRDDDHRVCVEVCRLFHQSLPALSAREREVAHGVLLNIVAHETPSFRALLNGVSSLSGAKHHESEGLRPLDWRKNTASMAEYDWRVRAGLLYIVTNAKEQRLSLRLVADQVRLSPWYFDKLLTRATGNAFKFHVRSVRLELAKAALSDGRLTVKEVAALAGFGQTATLDRHFRSAVGCTPTEFRERLG